MPALRRLESIFPALAFTFAVAVLVLGLDRHGIWDPTELALAESVREHARFELRPPGHGMLVALGFAKFGVQDWSGRVFGALSVVLVVIAAMGITRSHADARTAGYAAILTVATPMVVLNARWMVGDAAALGAHSLCGLGLFVAAFARTSPSGRPGRPLLGVAAGWLLALVGAAYAIWVRGALLGVLPPLLAISGVTFVEPGARSSHATSRRLLAGAGLALGATVAALVVRDAASYSVLLGGVPGGESPPSFERFLQIAFHTLAPTSAVFVLAAARSVVHVPAEGTDDADATPDQVEQAAELQRVRLALVLWAVFAWGAATLFSSRYGAGNFLGVVPVAVLAAMTLREAETHRPVELGGALVVALLLGLLIRDYALYPASPLAGVPVPPPTLDASFQPKRLWAALFGLFAVAFVFGAASRSADGWTSLRQPFEAIRGALTTPPRRRRLVTVVVAALVVVELVCLVFAVIGERIGLTSLVVRVLRGAIVVLPVAPVVATVGLVVALFGFAKLRSARMVPAVLVAGAVAVFVHGPFLVALSSDLSPREVYATYNQLRGRADQLVEFDVGSRASTYYADGEVVTVQSQDALVAELRKPGRRWALFRRNILAEFNRHYRAAVGRHLVLADASNLEVVLATNQPIPGRPDQNPIVHAVRTGNVRPQHPVGTRLEHLELVGYDLELPNGDTVGAGQSFRITWYWKVLSPMQFDWRIFVHVDGAGLRLNGDHDPVEGLLPTRQWEVGDVIADTQELEVPATYPSQPFTIYVGLYHAETRMRVREGNHTPDDRVIAGTLEVR